MELVTWFGCLFVCFLACLLACFLTRYIVHQLVSETSCLIHLPVTQDGRSYLFACGMGQFFDPVRGLCYYGTSVHCTGPPSAPTEDISHAVNSSLHPAAVVSRDTNDIGFSRYSIELNSKDVLPGKCLDDLPATLPLGYCAVGLLCCCAVGYCVVVPLVTVLLCCLLLCCCAIGLLCCCAIGYCVVVPLGYCVVVPLVTVSLYVLNEIVL